MGKSNFPRITFMLPPEWRTELNKIAAEKQAKSGEKVSVTDLILEGLDAHFNLKKRTSAAADGSGSKKK